MYEHVSHSTEQPLVLRRGYNNSRHELPIQLRFETIFQVSAVQPNGETACVETIFIFECSPH